MKSAAGVRLDPHPAGAHRQAAARSRPREGGREGDEQCGQQDAERACERIGEEREQNPASGGDYGPGTEGTGDEAVTTGIFLLNFVGDRASQVGGLAVQR